jgi:hypothetical protein
MKGFKHFFLLLPLARGLPSPLFAELPRAKVFS